MSSQEKLLTLSQIKDKYPLSQESFTAEDGQEIKAWVIRDEEGLIIYVAPHSIKCLKSTDQNTAPQ